MCGAVLRDAFLQMVEDAFLPVYDSQSMQEWYWSSSSSITWAIVSSMSFISRLLIWQIHLDSTRTRLSMRSLNKKPVSRKAIKTTLLVIFVHYMQY